MVTQPVVVQADITTLDVDAVVTAANAELAGGGGVDGAVHLAAGPELLEACSDIGGCPTGSAVITPGYALKADWVIHAVGPIWFGGDRREPEHLRSAYRCSLQLARDNHARSIAFPAISCGVYGYPIESAVRIAVDEVLSFLTESSSALEVVFCCFDARTTAAYREELQLRTGARS